MLKAVHIPSLSNESDGTDEQNPGKEKPLRTYGSVGQPRVPMKGSSPAEAEMGDNTLLYLQSSEA